MGNFTTDCPNGSLFIWNILKECTEDGRDLASVVLGLFSVLCFMMAAFPQCYSSYLKGNMDQAVSIWFLIGWLAGDSCNAIGAFLAQQLPIQIYTAIYYVLVDVIMVSLYIYYAVKNRSRPDGTVINAIVVFVMFGATVSLFPGNHLGSPVQDVPKFTRRSLLAFPHFFANQWKRKSTEGISPFLFTLMIVGNLTYGLSVLLKEPRQGQSEGNYVVHHLPWLIGSLGTMGLDVAILFQFFIYQEQKSDESRPLINSSGHRAL
ncbi:lysosomal amino acid transporter 1 homolog isoform X2 [Chiloscyllium plagiosum]|uniref:lysosomal amino acid transporter 1 homolog isoform X2 n=1 Tax=Chiloscyllium plagiosum TaxID=36176 RepID=UPI001CB7EC42|nr:lysosomal amino acid transporter 1 homolog isoform X2 [Chiloscyllium plagiosum]